jgi:hypothetical protein
VVNDGRGWSPFGVSSADPGKLLDYSTRGLCLSQDLVTAAGSVSDALDLLAGAADPDGLVPSADDVAERLTDLADGWVHLDEYVGDVGRGFALLLDPSWDGDRTTLDDRVVTGFDMWVTTLGRVGYADRDDAVRAARDHVGSVRELLDADRPSSDDVDDLAGLVGRGRFDPAYAVAFVEALRPEGLTDLVGLIERGYHSPTKAEPREVGWGLTMLAPFSAILGTALDTVPDMSADRRVDADDARLRPQRRLSDGWVDEFLDRGLAGDASERFRHSLLVAQAELPADLLVALADAAVTALIRGAEGPTRMLGDDQLPVWGVEVATVEANVLRSLARNVVASGMWLARVGADGRTNAEALATYDPRRPGTDLFFDELAAAFRAAASEVWGAAGLPGAPPRRVADDE